MAERMMRSPYTTTLTMVSVQDSFMISCCKQECVMVCVRQYERRFRMKGSGKKNANPPVKAAIPMLVTVGPVSTEACCSGW